MPKLAAQGMLLPKVEAALGQVGRFLSSRLGEGPTTSAESYLYVAKRK
jgi:hypothetical protein